MRKLKMQFFNCLPFSWIILLVFVASCTNAAKLKVSINKCCRFGDHLTLEKTCAAGGGFEKWAPKVFLPLKGTFFNKTGELPAFMKAEEDSFPKNCTDYMFYEGSNKVIIMINGSLYINSKDVMVPPEDYCVEKDAALVCLHVNNLTDPGSLTKTLQVTKVNKCCGPRQAYIEHNSTACVNLDKNHELYSAKIIQEANVDISYSFPDCETNDYAIAGAFVSTNFDPISGDLTTESGKLFKSHQFCLDNMLGDVNGVHIFTCSEHYKEVEVQTPTSKNQDSRFFIYSIGLIISVVFLLATLAVGFLVQSNHHLLHWRCQTNYVCCLLVGDLLLATTQIAGESIAGLPCKFIATSMHFFFLAAFFWLNAMCINIWWTFRDFRPSSIEKGQERFRLRIYEVYAWGLPIIFSGVAVILDNIPVSPNETFLRPRFGENKCWFYDKNWLNGVHISHFHDTFCFGYSNKLVILSSRWQKEEQQNVFSIDWRGELDDQNHLITSILAYPINGGSNYLDWTCILIGLSSGSILFYSDTGSQLHQQSLHTQPVYSIKACYNEELYVSFNDCVITIQTLYLVPVLKTLKESINKPKLNVEEYLLNFKKWEFKNKDLLLNDSVLSTQQSICAFDHLLGESLEGGFNKKYRNTPSQSSVVLTTGTKPFVSVHSCREGFKQNGITDVAKALVSKVTSTFLPNWLSGAQPTSQAAANAAVLENASEYMLAKHELIDYQRQGCNIWMSPQNYNLAVVADSVGRIILLDIRLGIMIRMWKGYREVQCGFVEVTEPRNKKDKTTIIRRTGLFLIIYAPKKSIIEIWSLQRGPKVATFAASRSGYLIYNVHGTPDSGNQSQLKSGPKNSCFFFDLEDNMIKEFLIPFHCTLSESNSKNAEDFYFLKKLKLNLKTQNFQGPEDILEICRKFQTNEIKIKCLELLTNCKKIDPSIIKQAIEIFLITTQELEDNQLQIQCKNYERLIDCYINARTIIDIEMEIEKDEKENMEKEVDEWELSETELNTIQKLIDLVKINKVEPTATKFVTFEDSEESIVSFLGSFHVGHPDGVIVNQENFNAYDTIGSVLFSNYWSGKNTNSQQLLALLKESQISCPDIVNSFLHFWLQKPLFFEEDEIILKMNRFRNILQIICEYAGDQIDYAYNSISLFWQSIREFFLECENPISALLASIVCKNYALVHQKSVDKFEISNWEEVSQEECQWTLLISKLDDVAVLAVFVSSKCESSAKLKFDQPKITLKKILNGGTGIISELVAKWLIGSNINVDLLFYDEKIFPADLLTDQDKSMLKKLTILKEHFPFSLNSSMLVSHIVWELMCHWSKNLMEIGYLKEAIGYLGLIPESHAHFQHGLCVLMWNSQFRILLKSTKTIINKTGRLPKEKFCLQDIGISDTLVPSFLEHTIQYLDCFLNSAKHSKIDIKFEEILQNGEKSLCELILQQKQVNIDLLKLHHELVSAMELIAFLNIKYPKPIQSVFDAVSYESFFVDLTKSLPYALRSKADEIRQNTRVVFLCKAISSSVELIFEDLQATFIKDHVLWVGKIKKLAVTWKLDIKPLDRHHIIQLYVFGWDDYAEELLEKFQDRENISTFLLEIAGQRLNLFLQDNRTAWTRIASGGPFLTNYLETLGKNDDANIKNVKEVSMDRLVKLAYRTYQMSSSSNNDSKSLRVAGQLYDVCVSFKGEV